MKAMVLAAGRGERMRPLTDHTPKPLLRVAGRSLIERQVERLVAAGCRDLVVNVSHLHESIVSHLGDGARLGAHIEYSFEPTALETAGGIAFAMQKLGGAAFLAVNADIYCEFDFARLARVVGDFAHSPEPPLAHLVLVPNPPHHPRGDFCLSPAGWLTEDSGQSFTFSGIGVYRPELFAHIAPGERCALGPLLHDTVRIGKARGELYAGPWTDVGTPERLRMVDALLGAHR